ncbi:MAG: methionine adenosyltransferase [Pseudomonadota bacterium]|nr:methionine adenosyltransferase [Pseudomonadota bacterium]
MYIEINRLSNDCQSVNEVEIVERKGLGHPDTICDGIAEEFSRSLCRFYHDRFGFVLHHNVDKALLWAGRSRPAFGGGEILEPMEIYLAGRATLEYGGITVPVEELAMESARNWMNENLKGLDAEKHVKVHCLVRPGSPELVDLYRQAQEKGEWLANDTSCGTGWAPLSGLEQMVLETENFLNSADSGTQHPEFGEDIKIMGVRQGDVTRLTLACALVDKYVADGNDYTRKKETLKQIAGDVSGQYSDGKIVVDVNAADDPGADDIYLTVTGTSAESGDDGQAGRGNRVNGLITPYRPMTMESAAGKNPVTHVGKLYNVAANRIAAAIVAEIEGVSEVSCYLVSQIGRPVDQPQAVEVRTLAGEEALSAQIKNRIEETVHDQLSRLNRIWEESVQGTLQVY